MRLIYLDYNATTPIAPGVTEALHPFLTEHYGNPSSSHGLGRACHEAVEDSRTRVANLLAAKRHEIVFTSGGTESNNLALKGVLARHLDAGTPHVVISTIEHPAVTEPARYLAKHGCELTEVAPNHDGVVTPDAVEAAIRPNTVLVSIMHANNEIGTVQPIRRIAEVCHHREILLHTDAAQSVGKIPTRVHELDADLLTIAGHKIYAPKGVGALYVRHGVAIDPVTHGAGHEGGLRPGTENVPYIVALGHAATLADQLLDESAEHMAALRDQLWEKIQIGTDGAAVANGASADRLPNTLSVQFPGVVASELLRRTPEVCASTGAACHSGETAISATLAAIGLSADQAAATVRLSVGRYTTDTEIDRAAAGLVAAWDALR